MGNVQKAEEFSLKFFTVLQNILGENPPDVANSFCNLAYLYQNSGNLQKAEEFYLKSLKIRQNLLGENHSDVALLFDNLGCCWWFLFLGGFWRFHNYDF